MTLPEFLKDDGYGFIHLAGHRIGLNHVIRSYKGGSSPEMIHLEYPTLPLALVHKTIAFYLENQAEVDRYMDEHDAEVERQANAARKGPSLAELRKRLERLEKSKPTGTTGG